LFYIVIYILYSKCSIKAVFKEITYIFQFKDYIYYTILYNDYLFKFERTGLFIPKTSYIILYSNGTEQGSNLYNQRKDIKRNKKEYSKDER